MSVSNLQRHPQPACPAAIRRARIPLAPPAVLAGHEARRAGFSLLEVMLATAILAASALVLSSLLGLGAKFGSRAEERTEALAQAQSLLDEFLAMPAGAGEPLEEITGELAGTPTRNGGCEHGNGGDSKNMVRKLLAIGQCRQKQAQSFDR